MNKASILEVILYAIQYFGTIALLLCSAIYLKISGEISAILIGAGYILYGIAQAVRVRSKAPLSLSTFGAVILVLGILCASFVIINNTIDGIIGFILKCLSGIAILIMVATQSMVNYSKRYSISKSARSLVNLGYTLMMLLTIAGAALTIFLQEFIEFEFYILSIVGCAIWLALTIYNVYLMITQEYDDTLLKTEATIFRTIFRQ